MSIRYLKQVPIAIKGGAIYPYSEELLESLNRMTTFGEPYNMGRVIGGTSQRRILVPRRMAPPGGADLRVAGQVCQFKSKFVPRDDEQARIIRECVALLARNENFMLRAPTGVGKTWMTTDIISKVGRKTLVIVTKEDIEDQWAIALNKCLGLGTLRTTTNEDGTVNERVEFGNGLGLIKADVCKVVGCSVVIAYVQSIAKNDRYPPQMFAEFGFVVWDECHRVGADFFSQSAYRSPSRLRMGISATTDRTDGKTEVMEAHIGPVMVESVQMAAKAKIIVEKSPWKCPMHPVVDKKTGKTEIKPIPHNAGKCTHIVKMLASHHGRNKMLCTFIAAMYKKGRHILVQSDFLDHLDTLTSLLPSYGVPVTDISLYVGGMTSSARNDAKTKPVVMATYQMTKEATDIPSLDTLVMCTPKSDVEQIVGRILRLHADKLHGIVFDPVDDSSPVFKGYYGSRKKWYLSKGFEVSSAPRLVKGTKPS